MCVCVCVYSHIPSLFSVSFLLPAYPGWKSCITVAVPLFFLLSETIQSSLSVALLCLCSALLYALLMLCEYLQVVLALFSYSKYQIMQWTVSDVFNVKIIFPRFS